MPGADLTSNTVCVALAGGEITNASMLKWLESAWLQKIEKKIVNFCLIYQLLICVCIQ